jgi:hypothetical protein
MKKKPKGIESGLKSQTHHAHTKQKPKPPGHWSQCFLEHAARETVWMRQHAEECDYASAYTAGIRRSVWLHAALLAQEKRK